MKSLRTLIACALLSAAAQVSAQDYYLGGDISLLPRYEELQQDYKTKLGVTIPDMLNYLKGKNAGWNAQRVRLFVDPSNNEDPAACQSLDYVTTLGKRLKDKGYAFMLDFHYSDTWADPGQQTKPAAWKDLSTSNLETKVYDYTKETLEHLVNSGATPDFIQVGNEVTCGMLWDDGRVNGTGYNKWNNFVKFLKAGVKACREVCPEAKIIIHLEHIQNATYTVNNFKNMTSRGLDFDILGLSYYPFWHNDLQTLATTINALAAQFPTKDVHIVETAYYYQNQPEVGGGITYDFSSVWPISAAGQAQYAADLVEELKKHDNVKGLFWWFPEENGSGPDDAILSAWMNRGLWDNSTHRVLPALAELKAFLDRPKDGVQVPAEEVEAEEWYSLQGVPVGQQPKRSGIYVQKGHKVVVK